MRHVTDSKPWHASLLPPPSTTRLPINFLRFNTRPYRSPSFPLDRNRNNDKGLLGDEDEVDEHQPFPSLSQIFQAIPEHVGCNTELKWICQMKKGGKRRIVFSCLEPDVCTMLRLPHSGDFRALSRADGQPLPDHSDRHKFR